MHNQGKAKGKETLTPVWKIMFISPIIFKID